MTSLVVYCHPVETSFVAALRDRVVAELTDADHDVDLWDLYAEGFDPRLTAHEHSNHLAGLETKPELAEDFERLGRADAIVFVYPTWWSGQPAMLKGWIERVWAQGLAFHLPPGGSRLRAGLTRVRRVVAVTTHGSPKWVNAVQGEPGKRVITRGVRAHCGWRTRIRWVAFYGMDSSTPESRSRFIERAGRAVARL